ncbi:methyltransferase [Lithospermum erythrorhizon]|uniref:Methyltransferase n=1 Tax=Lithospermum erythrorhizon TaxID=34254 RepID=A0AAV3PGF8_LITER
MYSCLTLSEHVLLGYLLSVLSIASFSKLFWMLTAGITAASRIAAELGIPLTHRGVANSVRFLTDHSQKGGTDPLFVAENAADPDSTLVVYMELATLHSLASKLMCHGLPPDTPAAAIE